MKKFFVIAIICVLSAAAADDKAKNADKKPAAGMMPPKPSPEARQLRDLVGTWKTTDTFEKIEGMMPGGEGTSTETITLGPGGYSVIMHIKGTAGPMASFRALGVLTWNPDEKAYKMGWVDSMTPGINVGTGHKEGSDLVMTSEVKMGGKTYKTKDVMSDWTPTAYTLTSYMDDGTGEKKTMTIKATKEEAKTSKPESK